MRFAILLALLVGCGNVSIRGDGSTQESANRSTVDAGSNRRVAQRRRRGVPTNLVVLFGPARRVPSRPGPRLEAHVRRRARRRLLPRQRLRARALRRLPALRSLGGESMRPLIVSSVQPLTIECLPALRSLGGESMRPLIASSVQPLTIEWRGAFLNVLFHNDHPCTCLTCKEPLLQPRRSRWYRCKCRRASAALWGRGAPRRAGKPTPRAMLQEPALSPPLRKVAWETMTTWTIRPRRVSKVPDSRFSGTMPT